MPASAKKGPSLPDNDTNMPDDDNMSDNNQKRDTGLPTIQQRSFSCILILGNIFMSIMLIHFIEVLEIYK